MFLATVGIRPIVVHGGGKAISRAMHRSGLQPRFVQGHRVTDAQTLDIVVDVLANQVNVLNASPGMAGAPSPASRKV